MPPKIPESVRKRKLAEKQRRHRARLINIGEQSERWKHIKEITSAENDGALAKTLIDCYLERHATQTLGLAQMCFPDPVQVPLSSTPGPGTSKTTIPEPELSAVTTGSESDVVVHRPSPVKRKHTGVETRPPKARKSNLFGEAGGSVPADQKKKATRVEIELSSTDIEDLYDPGYDPDDPTYQPDDWIDISIVQDYDEEGLEECGVEEDVFDIVENDHTEDERHEEIRIPMGTCRLENVTSDLMTEEKYIVSRRSLETLIGMYPNKKCTKCGKDITWNLKTIGCTVDCKWLCESGHESYRWTSSAMMPNGVFLNNFQAVSSLVLSGNNFRKISLFARFLGLAFPGKTTFHNVQAKCVVPVVHAYWENLQHSALEEHRAAKIIVSGDGRMDSPGHSAKYCTYTVMNQSDKAILALEIVDKRETGLKSSLMEAKGFTKAMETINNAGVQVKEVVTDAHPQISKIMRTSYPAVRHSYDMWHGAKNLGKKINKEIKLSFFNYVQLTERVF